MKMINFNYFTIAASFLLTIAFVIPEGYGRSTPVQRNEWLYRSVQSNSQPKKPTNAKVPASPSGIGLRSPVSSSVSNSTKFVLFRAGGSSDGTSQRCRCVLFYQCNKEDVIDTTSPEFLNESNVICAIGSEVCCREPVDSVVTETLSTGSLFSSVSTLQPLPITFDFTTSNPVVVTGGGDDTPCICIPEEQCFIPDPDKQISGAGLINVRFTECRPNEVCCLQEDIASPSPFPTPSQFPPTPSQFTPQTYTQQPPIVVTDSSLPPIDTPEPQFTCGIRNLYSEKEIDTRIISPPGVSDTVFGEFPWMAILLKTDINANGYRQENVFQCGASIISHSIILTAAHCIPRLDMSLMKIRIGEYNTLLGSKKEPLPHQESNISTILIHPDFNPSTLFNDVAIIVTEKRFNLTRNANPICLPANVDEISYNPHRCVATGWGKHTFEEGGRFQTTLKKVELGLVPNNECQRTLKKTRLGHYFKLHPSFICAGGQPGADTCQGDGGGPLVCELNNEPNRYVQVGIVSWGIGCGDEIPGVYASVTANLKWINEQISALTFNGIFRGKQG